MSFKTTEFILQSVFRVVDFDETDVFTCFSNLFWLVQRATITNSNTDTSYFTIHTYYIHCSTNKSIKKRESRNEKNTEFTPLKTNADRIAASRG